MTAAPTPPAVLTNEAILREARHLVQDGLRGRADTWEAVYACALVDLAYQAAEAQDRRRQVLVDTILAHWPTSTAGCVCGGVGLGRSFPEHLADMYEAAFSGGTT